MTSAQQIARLARAFPRQDVPRETFELYLAELADVPPVLLDQAVTALIRSEEWFPTVARIRRECAEHHLALPTVEEALGQIDGRARRRDVDLHPLAAEALRVNGGLPGFRSSTDPARARAALSRTYTDLRNAALRDAQLGLTLETS